MKKKIFSFVVSISILINMVACSLTKSSKKNIEEKIPVSTATDETSSTCSHSDVSKTDTTNTTTKYESEEPIVNHVEYSDYLKQLDDIIVKYNHEEYYPSLEDINKYREMASTKTECPDENTFSCEDLISTIVQNTINTYGEENGIFSCGEEEKELVVLEALRLAFTHIHEQATNDFSEDLCVLKNICIVNRNLRAFVEGSYNYEANTIVTDFDEIKFNCEYIYGVNNTQFVKYLSEFFEHELAHARQHICKHRKDLGQKYENISTVGEGLSFMLEASAESMRYKDVVPNDFNTYNYAYPNERECESMLFLIGAFINKNKDEYYDAVFDTDIDKLYDFLDLESAYDLLALHRVLYSLDTLSVGNTELAKAIYDKNNEISYGKLKEIIGKGYRQDIFKLSTKNLIKAVERDNLSLDEALILYALIKSYVFDGILYNDTENEISDFEITIINIEEIFSQYLSQKFGFSVSYIYDIFKSVDMRQTVNDFLYGGEVIDNDQVQSICEALHEKYPTINFLLHTNTPEYYWATFLDDSVEKVGRL